MHFIPKGAFKHHSPELATQTAHQGIRSVQNYVLLVESGLTHEEVPAELIGSTDPEMAKIAKRLGFTVEKEIADAHTGAPRMVIRAPFATLKEHAFSEDILKLDRTLSKRLIGSVAVQKPES